MLFVIFTIILSLKFVFGDGNYFVKITYHFVLRLVVEFAVSQLINHHNDYH